MEESQVPNLNDGKIVLRNKDLNNAQFMSAFHRLTNTQVGVRTSYKLSYIKDKVDRHVKQGRQIFADLAKKYAKLDENENLIPTKNEKGDPVPGTFEYKDDSAKAEFAKEQEEFMTIEHVIPKHKLTLTEFETEGVKFSANDISALAPLFSDLDA